MSVWKFAFRILFVKGIKWQIFLSNLGCDGVNVSTFHPMPFIEQHKVLKNLIHDGMEAATISNV